MNTSENNWTVRNIKSEIDAGNINTLREVGLLDEETIDYLHSFKDNYQQEQPWQPKKAEDTERWEELVNREVSKALRRAVKNNKLQEIAYMLGLPEEESGYSPYVQYERLRNIILSETNNSIIYAGGMGSGKTADALRTMNFATEITKTNNESIITMVNEQSVANSVDSAFYVSCMYDVMDILAVHDADRYILIIDEASSFLTGYGGHMSDVSDFRLFVRRARKMGLLGIYIGHRLTDITPDIRNLDGTTIFHKPNQNRTLVYDEIKDANETDQKDPRVDLRGLKDTEIEYETEGFAPWSFEGIRYFKELIQERGVTGIEDFREIYLEERDDVVDEDSTQKDIMERMKDNYQGLQCIGINSDGSRCEVKHGLDAPGDIDPHLKKHGLCEKHAGIGIFDDNINQHQIVKNIDKDPYEFSEEDWNNMVEQYKENKDIEFDEDSREEEKDKEKCKGVQINENKINERCDNTEEVDRHGYCNDHRSNYLAIKNAYGEGLIDEIKPEYQLSEEEIEKINREYNYFRN